MIDHQIRKGSSRGDLPAEILETLILLLFPDLFTGLDSFTVRNHGREWCTHLLLQGVHDHLLELLLGLHLLIQHTKSDILEIGDGRDLFVEDAFLVNNVDQELIVLVFFLLFTIIRVRGRHSNPIGKGQSLLVVKFGIGTLSILQEDLIDLTGLKPSYRVVEFHRSKWMLFSLLNLLVDDFVWSFL